MLRKRILCLAKPGCGLNVWQGSSQRPVLSKCLDITSLVTEAKERESGKSIGQQSRACAKENGEN